MEAASRVIEKKYWKQLLLLTKPGIIFGNLVTAIGGFFLGCVEFSLINFFSMLISLSCLIGSACVFNNIIDKDLDSKMVRTKKRALPNQEISLAVAALFGCSLLVTALIGFYFFSNLITLCSASLGFIFYVYVYSFLKYKTVYGTLIGSIAGAIPPVAGYTSVTNQLDLGALFLFLLVALWQMPHFIAIGIYRLSDYKAGQIPIVPIIKGIYYAKWEMFFYIFAFMITCYFFTFCGFVSSLFFFVMGGISVFWIYLSLKGFQEDNTPKWARKMFIYSLIVVMSLSILIPFTKL